MNDQDWDTLGRMLVAVARRKDGAAGPMAFDFVCERLEPIPARAAWMTSVHAMIHNLGAAPLSMSQRWDLRTYLEMFLAWMEGD